MLRGHAARAEHYHFAAKVIVTCTGRGERKERRTEEKKKSSELMIPGDLSLVCFYSPAIPREFMAHLLLPLFDALQYHKRDRPMPGESLH